MAHLFCMLLLGPLYGFVGFVGFARSHTSPGCNSSIAVHLPVQYSVNSSLMNAPLVVCKHENVSQAILAYCQRDFGLDRDQNETMVEAIRDAVRKEICLFGNMVEGKVFVLEYSGSGVEWSRTLANLRLLAVPGVEYDVVVISSGDFVDAEDSFRRTQIWSDVSNVVGLSSFIITTTFCTAPTTPRDTTSMACISGLFDRRESRVFVYIDRAASKIEYKTPQEHNVLVDIHLQFVRQKFARFGSFETTKQSDFVVHLGIRDLLIWDTDFGFQSKRQLVKMGLYGGGVGATIKGGGEAEEDGNKICSSGVESDNDDLEIAILVPTESPSTLLSSIFFDVISTLDHSLSSLPGVVVKLVYCPVVSRGDCSKEKLNQFKKIITIAPHVLGQIFIDEGEGEKQLIAIDPLLLPEGTILYNYEVVPANLPPSLTSQSRISESATNHGTFLDRELLEFYGSGRYEVWDYSIGNAAKFRAMFPHVKTSVVPLGFSPSLVYDIDANKGANIDKDIDILFAGTLTPHRRRIIDRLRHDHKLPILVPNSANWGSYGPELDYLVQRSKIVLSLRTFAEESEWKMTRFLRLLANAAFVVAEVSGSEEEGRFSAGIVFGHEKELGEILKKYLDDCEGREKVAKEGRRIIGEEDMSIGLKVALGLTIPGNVM